MDAVALARCQFGFSIAFHFLFPATTLGLTLVIAIVETLYLKTRDPRYRQISAFWVRLLALVFVLGVASGVTMEFSFGTNWAGFVRVAGDVFGPPLAAETITAFSVESLFLAILVFGRDRVSPVLYWLSALVVFLASHLSGFWILAANSWMHTPDGFQLVAGRAVLTDLGRAVFNHSTWVRFAHVILAAWMTGAAVVAGIAASYVLRRRHLETARPMLGLAVGLYLVLPLLQLVVGHTSAVNIDTWQPAKSAAMEGVFQTTHGAALLAFGIPDAVHRVIHVPLGVPRLLSFLVWGNFDGPIRGLNEFPESEWPPVNVVFTTFHLMVALGIAMIGIGMLGGYLAWKRRIETTPWFLRVLVWTVPFPYLAFELGWMGTELGRQPWIIQGVLKTRDAVSTAVSAGQIRLTLTALVVIYAVLLGVFLVLAAKLIQDGPEAVTQKSN